MAAHVDVQRARAHDHSIDGDAELRDRRCRSPRTASSRSSASGLPWRGRGSGWRRGPGRDVHGLTVRGRPTGRSASKALRPAVAVQSPLPAASKQLPAPVRGVRVPSAPRSTTSDRGVPAHHVELLPVRRDLDVDGLEAGGREVGAPGGREIGQALHDLRVGIFRRRPCGRHRRHQRAGQPGEPAPRAARDDDARVPSRYVEIMVAPSVFRGGLDPRCGDAGTLGRVRLLATGRGAAYARGYGDRVMSARRGLSLLLRCRSEV